MSGGERLVRVTGHYFSSGPEDRGRDALWTAGGTPALHSRLLPFAGVLATSYQLPAIGHQRSFTHQTNQHRVSRAFFVHGTLSLLWFFAASNAWRCRKTTFGGCCARWKRCPISAPS